MTHPAQQYTNEDGYIAMPYGATRLNHRLSFPDKPGIYKSPKTTISFWDIEELPYTPKLLK